MGSKNWPAWLKGGFIGFALSILIILLIWTTHNSRFEIIARILERAYYLNFITIIFRGFGGFTMPISFFVLGAIIGWIIGKIKSKK